MGDDAYVWSKGRTATFALVVALHVALAWLLIALSAGHEVAANARPVELIPLPMMKPVPVHVEHSRPEHLRADLPVSTPPALEMGAATATTGSPTGRGAAVNWTAEAHRAVKAFEIRRDAPPSDAITSPWDPWRSGPGHQAGDRFKTEDGDWIVWIDAECYQIATWHSGSPPAAEQPRTVCLAPPAKPRH